MVGKIISHYRIPEKLGGEWRSYWIYRHLLDGERRKDHD